MSKFTEEQQRAICSTGKTIVSASAGSGKTTVMIEKIVRLIKSGVDVGQVLAVTFTKKAAAQMKEKLRKELIKAINSPETDFAARALFKKQLSAVGAADISTIHAFCGKLIRSHFFAAGVASDFSIVSGDDAEGAELKNRALDELFEEGYAELTSEISEKKTEEEGKEEKKEGETGDFARLLSVYWRKKSDNRLREILLSVYEALRQRADYRSFLAGEAQAFTEEKFDLIAEKLFEKLREKCLYYRRQINAEREFFLSVSRPASVKVAESLIEALEGICSAGDYFAACAFLPPAFPRMESPKKCKLPEEEEIVAHLERLSILKKKVQGIYKDNSAVRSRGEELEAYLGSGKIAKSLAVYLLKLDEKYEAAKRERNMLDYNDLEHIALRLLCLPAVLAEVRAQYKYVFIDEYQDVNPVQEKILSLTSGENVFLVGDVKQSIYGFRGSKSRFFLEKQRLFEQEEGASSLFLTKNFRSSDAVIDAVNEEFCFAMSPQNSVVDYAKDGFMSKGGGYQSGSGRVQFHYVPSRDDSSESETSEGAETLTEGAASEERDVYSVEKSSSKKPEVSSYAKHIRRLIERELYAKYYDTDTNEYRKVEYKDIAILARKNKGRIEELTAALVEAGVPMTSGSSINVCKYPEVKTLIDILSLIDNAEQDIPLCSALLSAMGGLTADDLSLIRLAYPDEEFFRRAAKRYAEEKQDDLAKKLNEFYAYFSDVRLLSNVAGAGEILNKIISDTRMEARLLALDNGSNCLKRVRRFIGEACSEQSFTVHEFLDHLRALDYEVEYNENGGENAVRVITIHGSKGLEYPVVILFDIGEGFHGSDDAEVLCEESFGLAPKYYDTENFTYSSTLLRMLAKTETEEDGIADELNLFYVALTRAKYALHVFSSVLPSVPDVRYASRFSDFIPPEFRKKYAAEEDFFEPPYQPREAAVTMPDEELIEKIVSAYSREYAFSGAENLSVKSSASQLLRLAAENKEKTERAEEGDAELSVEAQIEQNAEGTENVENTGIFQADGRADIHTRRGIAYHAFLQYFDFSLLLGGEITREAAESAAKAELGRMERENLLTKEDAELLNVKKLTDILSIPIFSSLSDKVIFREQQFLAALPQSEIESVSGVKTAAGERNCEEEVLFQGVIDLLAVSPSGDALIVDYKYSSGDGAYLREHYAPQLKLYKRAVCLSLHLPEERVHCKIVNIRRGFQTDMNF